MEFSRCSAQLSSAPRCRVLCLDSAWDSPAGAVTQCLAGDNPTSPLLFGRSEHHPDLGAHVSYLKAFRAADAKGHPVLHVSSCCSGSHIGHSRARSHLSTLNMGGRGSLGKTRFLILRRWQLLSAFPALPLEIVFFCILHLWSCVHSMILKNVMWEKTF